MKYRLRKSVGECLMRVRVWKLLALFFIVVFALSVANSVHAAGVIGTVKVGDVPWAVTYDSVKNEIFVVNEGKVGTSVSTGTVSVIADNNNTVVATIPVGVTPRNVVYDSGVGKIYVANTGSGYPNDGSYTISVISDATNSVIATIPQLNPYPQYPNGLAYDPEKGEIFVAYGYWPYLSVISDKTDTVCGMVFLNASSSDVVYDSGKGELFATLYNNTIAVVADSNNTVTATTPINGPGRLAYDSAKGEIFVTCAEGVSVISDTNNTVVATIPVSGGDIAYDSGRGEVFLASGSNTVYVISDSDNSVVENLTLANPNEIAYDSGKNEVFVTDTFYEGLSPSNASNTVWVISDAYLLAAPSIFPSSKSINQDQSLYLDSATTTGIPPYTYQWFNKAPNALVYSPINDASLSSYSFVTSNLTTVGNWSFMLQVTDATGATVNSTATTVTVHGPPSLTTFGYNTITIGLLVLIAAVSLCLVALILTRHRRTNANSKQTEHRLQK